MKKILSAMAAASATLALGATDATWTGSVDQIDNGSWTTAANWSSDPSLPGGAGSTIEFPKAEEGAQRASTTMDDAFTVGTFKVSAASRNWTFNPGTGGSLTFDKGDGTMPELNVTAGTRGLLFNMPIGGTDGLLVSGASKSFVTFAGANTYSGETLVTGPYLTIDNNNAVGNTSRYHLLSAYNVEVFLRLNVGVTLAKDVVLEGSATQNKGSAHIGFYGAGSGSGEPDTVINGNIYCASPSAGAQIFVDADERFLAAINGNILEYDPSVKSDIGLRGDAGTCIVNGKIDLPNGTLTKNGKATWILANGDNRWKGTTVLFNGVLKMGAAGAYSPGAPLQLTEYGTGGTFDLNGYDQTIGPLIKAGCASGTYFVKSDTPAVLTMNVTDNSGNNTTSKGPVVFEGALTLRKTGTGTQSFVDANGQTTALVTGGIEVLEGRLNLNNALNTAQIAVDGGTLAGTTTLKYTAAAPETFAFKSGTCDVSNMTVTFSEGEVPYGEYVVFDYSGADAANLTAAGESAVWPFAGLADGAELPAGCRWRHVPSEKKVCLTRLQPGFGILIR